MKLSNLNVDKMQVFLIINNVVMKISVYVNVKNWLIKKCVMKNLYEILGMMNVNDKSCDVIW